MGAEGTSRVGGEGDSLRRFVIERSDVRGELVRLDASWRAIAARRPYPPPVRTLLGEAAAAAVLLAATVKVPEGAVTLQAQGSGPVPLLVVQATGRRTLRGLAHWREPLPRKATPGALLGDGRLVVTLDPGEAGRERYQGIVPLAGPTLAACIEGYFARSEQLPTRLWLAAAEDRAAGLLLQRMPGRGGDPDAWERAVHLAATVTPAELLGLPAETLLHRLYHQEDVRLYGREPVAFRCGCSRARIEEMLRRLGPDEARAILAEEGRIVVDCEFCGQRYELDAVDVERIFAAAGQPEVPATRH